MNIDLVTIFINLSESLPSIERMVTGFGYIAGIYLIMGGFLKLKNSDGRESPLGAFMHIGAGALLLFLPSSIDALSNTFFGAENILEYNTDTGDPFYNALYAMIKTSGVIWFVRGCILLLRMGKQGIQDGSRGLVFISAGILSINIQNTMLAIEYSLNMFISMTKTVVGN